MFKCGITQRNSSWPCNIQLTEGQSALPSWVQPVETTIPQTGQWDNGLVTPPGTPWPVELLLGEAVSDVLQIPDCLYSPSGPQVAQDTSSSLVLLNIVSSVRSYCFTTAPLITAAKCQLPDRFTRTSYCHSPPLSVSQKLNFMSFP